ncbi:putative tick adams, partial [Operophtera brumata]
HKPRTNNATPKETNTFEYFIKQNYITIPVTVHLDKALTRYLPREFKSRNREKVKKNFRNILNNVEDLFRRPSLNQTVQFTLLDVKFLKNSTKFVMDENVSKYLNSYCQWQGEKKTKKKWYYSILFTGLDLFYYGRNNTK